MADGNVWEMSDEELEAAFMNAKAEADSPVTMMEEDDEEIDELLEITSGISYYNDREITDDILEEIKEDKMYRGENIDDL